MEKRDPTVCYSILIDHRLFTIYILPRIFGSIGKTEYHYLSKDSSLFSYTRYKIFPNVPVPYCTKSSTHTFSGSYDTTTTYVRRRVSWHVRYKTPSLVGFHPQTGGHLLLIDVWGWYQDYYWLLVRSGTSSPNWTSSESGGLFSDLNESLVPLNRLYRLPVLVVRTNRTPTFTPSDGSTTRPCPFRLRVSFLRHFRRFHLQFVPIVSRPLDSVVLHYSSVFQGTSWDRLSSHNSPLWEKSGTTPLNNEQTRSIKFSTKGLPY